MKYLSVDFETTGLDRKRDQVLQIALVEEDSRYPEIPLKDLPCLRLLCKYDRYEGSAFALVMNSRILAVLDKAQIGDTVELDGTSYLVTEGNNTDWEWGDGPWRQIKHWLRDRGYSEENKPIIAGENVSSFDFQFIPDWLQEFFQYRAINAESAKLDWSKDKLEGLEKRLQKIDPSRKVTHGAYQDALDVIEFLRTTY
jgi:hypothetical protein